MQIIKSRRQSCRRCSFEGIRSRQKDLSKYILRQLLKFMRVKNKSFIYAVITVLIWSTLASVVKSLLHNIPNLEALCISSLLASLSLLAGNLVGGRWHQMKAYSLKDYGIMAGLGFIGLYLYGALYYFGLSQLSSQEACILNYLWPAMLVLFSCLILKERITPAKMAALLCSFIGVIVLTFGGGEGSGESTVLGVAACIAAAVCYGLFSVLNKKRDYDQGIAMMVMWMTAAVCGMISGRLTEQWVMPEGSQWFGMLWLGIMVDAVAYLFWALALKEAENTAAVANLAYLTPFLSLIVSAAFLKEKTTINAVFALILIVGGILLQNITAERERGQKNPDADRNQ